MTIKRAIELRQAGNGEEAKQLLSALHNDNPGNAEILYQLAWTCDSLGLEREAVPYYEEAIRIGLPEEDERGALLGLGSTYRTLGRYEDADALFRKARAKYPERREFRVFHAMALYNLGDHAEAMKLLLAEIAETSGDPGITDYKRAIAFYSDKLDQIWN
ncbi:tetratricopeptide repeat protein [Paenibacillus thailandensis]|jgi:tetratricopeptide (TPR) repeat protein|uniref:Tetratricopeptide repeat protein n=1 Tax=Paenibacillus thailandensis TaxID=393250 RepID=A0ABW5R143_9BACL